MENCVLVGTAIRTEAKQVVLDYLKNQPLAAKNEVGVGTADVFRDCGFSWGDCENASAKQQQYWVVGLLRSLEKDGIIQRDPGSRKWRLA